MAKNSSRIAIILLAVYLLFGINAFAQCGADGMQPCNPTPKKTVKKTTPTTKTTVTKPKTTSKTPSKTSVSKPQPNSASRVPEIEFVEIPSGSFMMGSENGEGNANPVHRVSISQSFYMGKYEITQAQWKTVMGNNPSYFSSCGGNCPVEQVSWDDAQEFIRKLNSLQSNYKYRLPTEAEWEYACRARTTGDYFGNLDLIAWYRSNSGEKTHPVGQKQSNAWGLYDMSGNVWEWCEDWYGEYQGGAVTDPTGATSGRNRVLRGGGWRDNAVELRSAYRYGYPPSYRDVDLGFRVLRY
jgi:formylglycine-generating enzyme required for sulfatase activity